MVLSAEVAPHNQPRNARWNLILHAHPKQQTGDVPKDWIVDSLLIGSLKTAASGWSKPATCSRSTGNT